MKKMLFSSMLVGALALPSVAFSAQDATKPAPPHREVSEGHVTPKGPAPVGPHAGHPSHMLRVAEHLSAIETAIGINSQQLNSWRAYTAALVNLKPQPPRPGEEPRAPKEMIPGEWQADRMIEQAEKAKIFKKAAEELRRELKPEQIARLSAFGLEMRNEHVGRDGPHHPKAKDGKPLPSKGKPHDDAKKTAPRP